jgi:DNA-binding winged helix-turn-helix (wHTH) protein/tetratricopeptide (TPR) repeat protein
VPVSPTETVIRFGLFELDLSSGQLRKNGGRIRIAQQPVQVLAMLLERPGEVVRREELRQKLWSPDTFVDFDHGLNKSVQKLRDALGDSAESPRFIETIPRVGYRFLAPVSVGVRPGVEERDELVGKPVDVEPVSEGSAAASGEIFYARPGWLWVAGGVGSLPEEAAMAIAKKTSSAVAERAPARYVNPEAQDAFMRGERFWYGGNDKALNYFQKAVELQPDYADGWIGLSQYYGGGMLDGHVDPGEGLVPMEVAAKKAVELDGSFSEAHIALCASIFFKEHDWARADRECVRAIELDPTDGGASPMRARIFGAVNRHGEGIAQEKVATGLGPYGDEWGLARSYLWARKYDLGIADARERLEASPRNAKTLEILAALYRCKGMYKEAAQAWEDMYSAQGDDVSAGGVRRAFAEGGYPAVVRWKLAELKKQPLQHYVSLVFFALEQAQLQEREETLRSLEEAYRVRDPLLLWVQDDPAYDFVHADERYRTIIKGMGLPPAY